MSLGAIGHGSVLSWNGTAAVPVDFQLRTFGGPSQSGEDVDITNFASPRVNDTVYREYIPGPTDPGTIEMEVVYRPVDASWITANQGSLATWTLTVPDPAGVDNAAQATLQFDGYIREASWQFETADAIVINFTLRVSGGYTYTEPTP